MKVTFDFIALSISKSINTPLLLLEMALMARILGPTSFGQWTLLVAAATLLHSILINWTHSITVRFGCEEWATRRSLNQTLSTRFPMILFCLLLSLFLITIQPMNWLVKLYSLDPKLGWLVFFNTLYLWLTFETQSNMQATGLLARQAILTPLVTSASILFLLFILLNFGKADILFLVTGVTLIKSCFWCSIWLLQLKKINFQWTLPTSSHLKNTMTFSWPLLPTLMLGYLSDWGDHILLGIFCTLKEVGVWGASYQIMLGIISLNSVLVTVLLPWLIARHQASSETSKYYLSTVVPALLSFWLMIVLVLITFFPALYFLFVGEEFNHGNTVLLILSMCVLTNIFASLYGILFNLQNRLGSVLLYNIAITVINFSLSILLIPRIGINGAALGTFISYLIGHSLYILDQHRFLKVPLGKISILFFVTLLLGFLQYFAGVQLEFRIIYCLFSLLLLGITIRTTGSIHPTFITQIFTGILSPIGFLLRKTLVTSHVNKYF